MDAAFITFEGIDGSGKSTQLRMLASELRLRGREVVATREPGGTPLGTRLREAVLDAQEHVDPLAELLLFAADRAQHVRTLVRPALDTGHIVLSDRYADSTVAFQGAGREFPPEVIRQVVALATEGLQPHLTLVFDISVAESAERSKRRARHGESLDRIDAEEAAFHARVREEYLRIAAAEPRRVRVIDASGSVAETHQRVMEIIMPFLEAGDGDKRGDAAGTNVASSSESAGASADENQPATPSSADKTDSTSDSQTRPPSF
ncbi:MAG TPA: dTMP kinase [Pyrinomonadaceae bacterium]|nr:dTMP kinase [Pyrinomonadaceae bacterium]